MRFTEKLLYVVESKLPSQILDEIEKDVLSRTYDEAKVISDVDKGLLEKHRITDVSWLHPAEWIPGILANTMRFTNDVYFKYDLEGFHQDIQATLYEGKKGSHYSWHVDGGSSPLKPDFDRKLSCSLLLSNPEEYKGGELQFHYHNYFFESKKYKRGDIVVFPAWLPHRVRPVTKGRRLSLVAWMSGPMFK